MSEPMPPIGIAIDRVAVDYPLFGAGAQTLQKRLLNVASFGRLQRDVGTIHVVNALKDLTFDLKPGSSVGLIGRNGAGKSTLLRLMAGVLEPTRGRISRRGKIQALLTLASGMEGELDGYQNIRRIGLLRGFPRAEIEAVTPEIVAFAQLGEFMALPVRTYSSGMMVRLAFAIATIGTPDILLIDEVFGAGDGLFRRRAQERIKALLSRSKSIVFSSHAGNLIREFCGTCLYLERGRIKAYGETEEILNLYRDDLKAVREADVVAKAGSHEAI